MQEQRPTMAQETIEDCIARLKADIDLEIKKVHAQETELFIWDIKRQVDWIHYKLNKADRG